MLNKAFLQKYINNRKKVFLQKKVLSAEMASFCRPKVPFIAVQYLILKQSGYRKRLFLPKEHLSAERQKEHFLSESLSAEFLPKFSAERPQKDPFG